MAGIDRLAEVMGVENDFDPVSQSKFLYEVADEIERLRAALASVKERCAKVAEALDAYRAYIDSSDQELADACVTRKELLRKARELDPYDGKTPVATTIRGLE
jgi:septal ring factor EnvC (AmiA/AmiB activator)